MGRVVFVTGFKGGVGKTTVSANIASSLRALGKKVLLIDGDFGMRCLDLVLGVESELLFDCSDVLAGRCSSGAATTDIRGDSGFCFIPAPMNYSDRGINQKSFDQLFEEVRDLYDFVIVDSCAEMTPYYMAFAARADEAIIVTLHQSTSVRAAEKTASRLSLMGLNKLSLVVNGFRKEFADDGSLPDIPDIIARSSVKLLGVVPYGKEIQKAQENAELAFFGDMRKKASGCEAAFFNIASRLCGRRIRLFDGVEKPMKRCLYTGIRSKKKKRG